jgi:single-stranded DNA-binding protein
MHCQLYLSGRLVDNPEIGETKKGRLWVRLLLDTQLVRETRPGEFQSESCILPISLFSQPAETVKALRRGDQLAIGCHLYGTEFKPDSGPTKRGVQLVADCVFLPAKEPERA